MYTAEQKAIVAHELARAGGNVTAALKRLREEYESFRNVGDATVRRMLREKGFAELVAQRSAIIEQASQRAALEMEQAKKLAEIKSSLLEKLDRDERVLDGLRKRIEEALNDPTKISVGQAIAAFADLTRIIDKRRESSIPVVAQMAEAHALVEAMHEASTEFMGIAKTKTFIALVREKYVPKLAALQGANA